MHKIRPSSATSAVEFFRHVLREKITFLLVGTGLVSQIYCSKPSEEINPPMSPIIELSPNPAESSDHTEKEVGSYPRQENAEEHKYEFFCSDSHKKLEELRNRYHSGVHLELGQCEIKEKEGLRLLKKLEEIYSLMFSGRAHDPELQEEAWKTLNVLVSCLDEEWAIEGLIKISHESPEGKAVKFDLAEILAEHSNVKVIEHVLNYLGDPQASPGSVSSFIKLFGRMGEFKERVQHFAMNAKSLEVRKAAIYFLQIPSSENATILLGILKQEENASDPNEDTQESVIIALADQPGEEVTRKLFDTLETGTLFLKNASIRALRGRNGQDVTLTLMEAFSDPEIPRGTLINALGCRKGTRVDDLFFSYIQAEMNEIKKLSEKKLKVGLSPEKLEAILFEIDEHQHNIERVLRAIKKELKNNYNSEKLYLKKDAPANLSFF